MILFAKGAGFVDVASAAEFLREPQAKSSTGSQNGRPLGRLQLRGCGSNSQRERVQNRRRLAVDITSRWLHSNGLRTRAASIGFVNEACLPLLRLHDGAAFQQTQLRIAVPPAYLVGNITSYPKQWPYSTFRPERPRDNSRVVGKPEVMDRLYWNYFRVGPSIAKISGLPGPIH